MNRKVFNYNSIIDDGIIVKELSKAPKGSISAGGVLFIKVINNKPYLLLISYTDPKYPLLDDLGGRTEHRDMSIFETIRREVKEESNDLIDIFLMDAPSEEVYINYSKYYLLVMKVAEDFYPDTSVFGTVEKAENIPRTIDWYCLEDVKNRLSRRLSYKEVFSAIDRLISENEIIKRLKDLEITDGQETSS